MFSCLLQVTSDNNIIIKVSNIMVWLLKFLLVTMKPIYRKLIGNPPPPFFKKLLGKIYGEEDYQTQDHMTIFLGEKDEN